jgi:hypothetical protein
VALRNIKTARKGVDLARVASAENANQMVRCAADGARDHRRIWQSTPGFCVNNGRVATMALNAARGLPKQLTDRQRHDDLPLFMAADVQ